MQAQSRHLGKAGRILPAFVCGTGGSRQEQCEFGDDGNVYRCRLEQALGERNERFPLLEHHLVPHAAER
jgi:hypothetical protein